MQWGKVRCIDEIMRSVGKNLIVLLEKRLKKDLKNMRQIEKYGHNSDNIDWEVAYA